MHVYGRKIVVLPFRRDVAAAAASASEITVDEGSKDSKSNSGSSILFSYTLNLDAVIPDRSVENVVDVQFLHGYHQPTMLIASEWVGGHWPLSGLEATHWPLSGLEATGL